jgi:4-hydroxybenzoyl-CoA reductase subunit beta
MLRLPKIDHISPSTVEESCSLLSQYKGEARVLAGGTDLLVACKLQNIRPVLLVSLKRIQDLKGIAFQEGAGVKIGAMTNLSDVRYNPYIMKYCPALSQAAAAIATPQLREMGTIGGNLCLDTRCIYYNQSENWRKSRAVCFKMGGDICHVIPKGKKCYATFSGDIAPALIALNAKAKLISGSGERVIPVEDIYSGDGKKPLSLRTDEVLTEIMIPPPIEKQSSVYLKYRLRKAICFPLVGVGVSVRSGAKGIIIDSKVVLTGVGPNPITIPNTEPFFEGKPLTQELVDQIEEKATHAGSPVANTPGSTPSYRRRMAGILTRRAMLAIGKNLGMLQQGGGSSL